MICAASVSYTELLRELQRRKRFNHVCEDSAYMESLLFDLHMAQKSLQRAIYNQQVGATNRFDYSKKFYSKAANLQIVLDYPER